VAGSFLVAIGVIAMLGYVSYRQVKKRSRMPTYFCRGCGSAWTMAFAGTKVEGDREVRKLRFLKSCPRCNKSLLAE
jgi:ribosomal protein S27AE